MYNESGNKGNTARRLRAKPAGGLYSVFSKIPEQTPLWQIGVLPMAEENMLDESMQGMLYTLEDEEGNEQEFEVLGEMEYEGANYCALIPYYENEEDLLKDDGEFVVLKREMVDGEEMLCTIEDDDEYDAVGNLFIQYLSDLYEDEEEEQDAQ